MPPFLVCKDVFKQLYTSSMKLGSGGNLGLSREYSKKLFGPMFYSWFNCPLRSSHVNELPVTNGKIKSTHLGLILIALPGLVILPIEYCIYLSIVKLSFSHNSNQFVPRRPQRSSNTALRKMGRIEVNNKNMEII